MSRYSYKHNYIWSADLAYLTGLIAADGCLVNNGRHLNVTSKDIELINHTQSILDMNVKFGLKQSNYGGEAYHLQFSNVAFYDFLLEAGLTPAKSKTIGALDVPDAYYPDFLRGYFDGDGSVYGFWDTRWSNSLMYYTCYTSASLPFLEWLKAMNSRLCNLNHGSIRPGKGAMTLRYAKSDSKRLFAYMYYTQQIPFLTRKHRKFIDFLGSDPYASKAF